MDMQGAPILMAMIQQNTRLTAKDGELVPVRELNKQLIVGASETGRIRTDAATTLQT